MVGAQEISSLRGGHKDDPELVTQEGKKIPEKTNIEFTGLQDNMIIHHFLVTVKHRVLNKQDQKIAVCSFWLI